MTAYTLTRTEYLEDHVEAEHVTCVPVAELGRDVGAGDHVDARYRKNGNNLAFLGRLHESKKGMVMRIPGLADLPSRISRSSGW